MAEDARGVPRILAQIVGLGAGLVGGVYICGLIVLGLRMAIVGLPLENILGQLPRDFVISVGLSQVVLPAAAVAALYSGYRVLRGAQASAPGWPRWSASKGRRTALLTRALLWTVVIALPGTVLPITQESSGAGLSWDLLFLLIPFVLIFLTTLVALDLLALLRERYHSSWNGLQATALAAIIVFGASAPGAISFASAISPPVAKICTRDGAQALTIMIGQSSDRLFLGDLDPAPRPLLVVPQSEVVLTVIGERTGGVPCFVKKRPKADARAASPSRGRRR